MFVLEESQLLEDTIKDRVVLDLYNSLKRLESSSSEAEQIKIIQNTRFIGVCQLILDLPASCKDNKLSIGERNELFKKLQLDRDDSAALFLIVAAFLTQIFVVHNFTGPKSDVLCESIKQEKVYQELFKKFDFRSLTIDGCEVHHLIENPWLLKTADLCWYLLNHLGASKRLLELEFLVWKHRFITIYLSVLHEPPEDLLKDLRKIQEFIFDHHLINDLKENRTQLTRFNNVELCCELVQSALVRDGVITSRKIFDYASELSGVTIEHTGVLGKRTRFQQNNVPQLVVKVSNVADRQQNIEKSGCLSHENVLSKDIELDDDTLLPDIAFVSDESKSTGTKQNLSVEAQLLMLTKLDYILKTEVMEESLKDEWTLAYLRSIIHSATVWAVKYKSLAHRSIVEKKHMRKMDRALLQLEELIKEADRPATNDVDTSRLESFYSVLPPSKWQMQKSLGDISFDLCLFKSALEIYSRIEYWESIIKCHSALGETAKAEIIIRQELAKRETPYLYCLLGDATDDIQYYEKAWTLSKNRFARAKKSIGTHHYVRKNYADAIDNYELALSASPSNISILSLLAYSCLLLERYERAAECYRNITYQDDTNFLAWNNLSKAYIKLNQKERAWRTLREAIKCNYEEPKIWENFMLVSVEIGALDDVISAWHRLVDIKGLHKDDQILSALTYALIKKSYSTTDKEFSKIFDDAIKLVARISTTAASSPRVWICYLRLLIRQHERSNECEDSKNDAKTTTDVDLNVRVGKIRSCLQRATPTTVVADANCYRSAEKIASVLDAYDELIDCFDLSLSILGERNEICTQWKYFKMSLTSTLKTLRQRCYALTI